MRNLPKPGSRQAEPMLTDRACVVFIAIICGLGLPSCGPGGSAQENQNLGLATEQDVTFSGQGGYAFVDVTVIPMDREVVVSGQTVLVDGDRIVTVAPVDDVQVPDAAEVIDGRGLYLMPGLADMHTHPNYESDLLLYPIYGVTMIRINADFGENLDWQKAAAGADSRYPNMFVAGPIIDVEPPWFPGSATLTTPDEARAEVDRQVAAGYDFIKIFPRFQPETYRTLIDTAHEHDRMVTGHSLFQVPISDVLEMGIDAIEHMDGYAYALQDSPLGASDVWPDKPGSLRTQQPYWLTTNRDRFQTLAAALVRYGTWTVPTLVVGLGFNKTQSEVDTFLASDLAKITHPGYIAWWRSVHVDEQTAAEAASAHQTRLRLIKVLHDAGAGIVAGTDSTNPFVVHGAALHDELSYFVKAGLTPYEALTKSTIDAARFLRQQDEFGRIASGFRADLLLLDTNPLEDISHTRNIAGVMLRGKWMPAEELAAVRAELEADLATTLPPE